MYLKSEKFMTSVMETTLKHSTNGAFHDNRPSNSQKGSTCNLLLKNLILKEASEKVIDNFYDPNLKLYIYPLVWSNDDDTIQYPSMNNDELTESARMILGENNSRELIEGNIPITSLSIGTEGFEVNLLLLAITFKDKGIIKHKIFDKIKQIVKKSDLNKLIKTSPKKDTKKTELFIQNLKVDLLKLSKYINNIEYLVHYRNKQPKPDTIITLNDKSLRLQINMYMKEVNYVSLQLSKNSGMPNMNGKRLLYERTRGSLGDLEKVTKPLSITNSVSGNIESILFALPIKSKGSERKNYLNVVRESIKVMPGVKIIMLIEMNKNETDAKAWKKQVAEEIKSLKDAIPPQNNTTLEVIKRDIIDSEESFSTWAQDAVIVGTDEANMKYLLTAKNPKREDRRNDGSIASRVAEHGLGYTLRKFDFQLEGGNVLVADDFILIGKDEIRHNGKYTTEKEFLNKFKQHIGDKRKVFFVQSSEHKPEDIPEEVFFEKRNLERHLGEKYTSKSNGKEYTHHIHDWSGEIQPIFHIDVFITLLGYNKNNEYEILVGQPEAGFNIKNETNEDLIRIFNNQMFHTQIRINECIENLERSFNSFGKQIKIIRNSLPLTYKKDGYEHHWYWATYNNCLIQNGKNKTVWLPTYGHPTRVNPHWKELKEYDTKNYEKFRKMGFDVHFINTDFHRLAQKNGSFHCISKCLSRNNITNIINY